MMVLRVLLSLLLSVGAVFFATRNVDWSQLRALLGQAHYWPLAWALMLSSVTFTLRAWRWQVLLNPFQKIALWQLLRWQVGGLLINNLLPMRMGELVRAYWTGHKTRIAKSSILGTIVVERVFDMASMAAIACAVLLGAGLYHFNRAIAVGAVTSIVILSVTAKLFIHDAMLQNLTARLPAKIRELADDFVKGLSVFKDKKEIFKVAMVSPLIWAADIFIIAVLSRTLGLDLSWMQAAVLAVGLILGVMIPAAPGAVGTYEAGGVAALGLIGFDATRAFSFVFLMHCFQIFTTIVLGVPVLFAEGFTVKQILNAEKEGAQ